MVIVRLARPVRDARKKHRQPERHVDKRQRQPRSKNIGLGVHPSPRHARHRVVVVDDAVMHQALRAGDEIGIACAGGAVGVELDGVTLSSATQHFREDQCDRTTEAMAADKEFLTGVEFIQVFHDEVVSFLRRFVKAAMDFAVSVFKRNLGGINIAQAIRPKFGCAAYGNQDQFVVVGDERLSISRFRSLLSVIEKVNFRRVFLIVFPIRFVDSVKVWIEWHDFQTLGVRHILIQRVEGIGLRCIDTP